MPEPTSAPHPPPPPPPTFAYQARLLERTSSLSRSGSVLSRSMSTASSSSNSGSSGSASSSTLYSIGSATSGSTLAEEVIGDGNMGGKGLGGGGLKRNGSVVGSVRDKWEQRVKAAEAPTSPQSTLGRSGSILAPQPSTSDTTPTPREAKRRTLPMTFAPPAATLPQPAPAPAPSPTPAPSTSPRVRRAISFDSPPPPPPSPPASASPSRTPTRAPLPRTFTAPQPTQPDAAQPQFRSAYMSAKHQRAAGMGIGLGRKVGGHLPRIASGDGPEDEEAEEEGKEREREREKEREVGSLRSKEKENDKDALTRFSAPPSPPKLASSRFPSGNGPKTGTPTPRPTSPFKPSTILAPRPPSPLKPSTTTTTTTTSLPAHSFPSSPDRPALSARYLPSSPIKDSPRFPLPERKGSVREPPSSPTKEVGRLPFLDRKGSVQELPSDSPRFKLPERKGSIREPPSSPTKDLGRDPPVSPTKDVGRLPFLDRKGSVREPPSSPMKDNEPPRTPKRERHISFPDGATPRALPVNTATTTTGSPTRDREEHEEVEVHGIPGRLRLSRNLPSLPPPPSPSRPTASHSHSHSQSHPTPSKPAFFKYALWADLNRANIQAYEYLCHVGEAMQWIEGALGRELGVGVVDFEEGLRDGVVLARLAQGWGSGGKVFEHPKLQWRHSDNINIFLEHVRSIGLPENFIFEFTDLYEKKNMPKVIYCIHALSHLLARRGLAQRMHNLVGRLEFSDDQLAAAQKGLNAAGVAMPNFGNVGKELWREMEEEPEEETEEEARERELAEAVGSVVGWQARARGLLARRRLEEMKVGLEGAERAVVRLQAGARGALARRRIGQQRKAARATSGRFVVAFQAHARGALARARWKRQRVELGQPSVLRVVKGLQARARGTLVRRRALEMDKALGRVAPCFVGLQAAARGVLARRRVREVLAQLDRVERDVVRLQACARGTLARRRWALAEREREAPQVLRSVVGLQARARGVLRRRRAEEMRKEVGEIQDVVLGFQAHARGALARRRRQAALQEHAKPQVLKSILGLQARARGVLRRRQAQQLSKEIGAVVPCMIGLQAHVRGTLVRQGIRELLARLDAEEEIIVRFQAAARGWLARRDMRGLIGSLRKATPVVIGLQARARACLARKAHKDTAKALAEVQVVKAVSGLQAFARAALTRKRHQEQVKQLEFVEPDVVGFQAHARGVIARRIFAWWWHYLHQHQAEATFLQALCRGIMARRRFVAKMQYYRANLSKVVKIQSLFRAKEQREQYRQLTMGTNVTVSTIKNFVHLLNDSEADFGDEIEVERLRKKVVECIRENQQLETYVNELDVKIALVVQNVKSFEELIKARRWHGMEGAGAHTSRASVLAAHGDPFAGPNTLDAATKRKLELYQQLFYLLQTRGDYLAKLFFRMSRIEMPEKTKRTVERVVLTLFGYGQRREDYLILKMFQHSIQEEVRAAPTIADIVEGHPMFLSIALHYVRPKQVTWVRDALQAVIEEVIGQPAFNLETDPVMIYRAVVNAEEMRSGISSGKPIDVSFQEAALDPNTRAEWIRHLQMLRHYTELFLNAITTSTRKVPYSIRCIARELLSELKIRFPGEPEEVYSAAIGKMVYYRFLNSAIIAPDNFDVVPTAIGAAARRNLSEIAKMLSQISTGIVFQDDAPSLIPLNSFIGTAITQMHKWFLEVADIPNPEEQLHAHEFLDATEQPRSIFISPNEVYAMHALLAQNLDHLVTHHDDTLRIIITELDGVPHLAASDELKEARDRAISLELTNRFSDVKDPNAGEKALWVHAKRGVLAVLRVQPAKDLMESLMAPVTDDHELIWEDVVANELPSERIQNRKLRMPSMSTSDSAYRLEDIQTQSYRDVKAHAMFYLIELEKYGKLTRTDGFQGILNAIASDVRSKHLKRLQRRNELESMDEALKHLAERKKAFEEQINSYHSYVDSAMNTMQRGKGKKRFVMPFTKQYFHLRDLQKAGKNPQFGSYKYSAQELYDKGILLSVDQFSPRQFDRLSLVIASDQVGEFTVELYNNNYGGSALMGSTTLRMEDLLQAQFENRVSLALFDGLAKVNLNLLLYQINKKFYV